VTARADLPEQPIAEGGAPSSPFPAEHTPEDGGSPSWHPLADGETPRPGFRRNHRPCSEGDHWWAYRGSRRGRHPYRCPEHAAQRRHALPGAPWQRRTLPAVEQGEAIREDGQLPVFSYVTVEKTTVYRVAIEAVAEMARVLTLQVRPEQIVSHLLAAGTDPELAREAAADAVLTKLVEWGNLDRMPDSTEPVRLKEFDRRRFVYQMSRAGGLAHEAVASLLAGLQQQVELSRARLENLEQGLRAMGMAASALPATTDAVPDVDRVRALRVALNSVFDSARVLGADATAFFTSMRRRQASWSVDEGAFRLYKDEVIRYIRDFVQELCDRHGTLRSLCTTVERLGIERLVSLARAYDRAPDATAEDIARDNAETLTQWTGLVNWIATTVDLIRHEAVAAVLRVEAAAVRIAESLQPRVSRHHDWLQLARWFDDELLTPDCADLYRRAFGPGPWFHLGGEAGVDEGPRVPWRADRGMEEAVVRPAVQGAGGQRGRPGARADYSEARRRARDEVRLARLREQRALSRVADAGPLPLSSLGVLAPLEFDAIVQMVVRALETPLRDGAWHASSVDAAATIEVRPPTGTPGAAVLATRHGRLHLCDLVIEVRTRGAERARQAS
jgi:uncharacterized protein (TIGR02677 family)